MFRLKLGVEDPITIAGRMNCALSMAGRRFNWFYRKILHQSTM